MHPTDHVPSSSPVMDLGPSMAVTVEAIEDQAPAGAGRKKLGAGAWLAIGWIVGLGVLAVIAPWIGVPDPTETFPEYARSGPSAAHWLGNDGLGRDLAARIIYGTRASYIVGFGAVAFGLLIGGFLGLVVGFFRGRVDAIITPLMTVLLAIPQFVLALALVTVLATPQRAGETINPSVRLGVVVLGLGLVSIPILGRITRATTMAWSEREFVLAARAMGAKQFRIMFREVLPNVVPAMLSIALLGVGIAIVAEGGLALFGAGVQLPTPSWGNIIATDKDQLARSPHIILITSMVIFLTVMALNYLGDVVVERFDVRESVL